MKRILLLYIAVLFSLLCPAEQLTLSVTAYNAVTASGDVPEGLEATYLQHQSTHYKSRLLAGDSATLSVTGLPAGTLDSIVLMMRSNANGGAGSLRLTVGGAAVWTIADAPFADASWAGTYSGDYLPVRKALSCAIGDLSLAIVASANSLYLQSVTLCYTTAPARAHTVRFSTQSSFHPAALTESAPGSGVTLPSTVSPAEEWAVIGWTETCEGVSSVLPRYWAPGRIYYPQTDITLHALYARREGTTAVLQDTLFSPTGEYALVMAGGFNQMASGSVLGKRITMLPCAVEHADDGYRLLASYVPQAARYRLESLPGSDSSDSVNILALADNTPVGYKYGGSSASRYLNQTAVPWRWMQSRNHSFAFYHHPADGYAQILMPENGMDDDSYWLSDQHLGLMLTEEYLCLFEVSALPTEAPEPLYSNYPASSALDDAETQAIDWLQPVAVYSADGRCIRLGITSPAALPQGLWIVRQGRRVMRLFKY